MRHIALVLGFLLSLSACADNTATSGDLYQEGKHYLKMSKAVPTIAVDKVEIAEVFRFGCPACFRFEQAYKKWLPSKAEYIQFVKTPVVWNDDTETRARVYFTAEKFGIGDEIAYAVFSEMHERGNKKAFLKDEEIAAEFAKHGIEQAKFEKMYNNWLIKSKVRQADERGRAFAVEGTPEIIVDGRYRVRVGLAGSFENMLKIASFLADKVAKEKGLAK